MTPVHAITASRAVALDTSTRTLLQNLSCVGKQAWIEPTQILQFGLFHGDPHPGNIFALADGRIAYVDFGNVAEVSQQNKQTLIDAVVHAVNEDYEEMAKDFIKLVRPAAVLYALCVSCPCGDLYSRWES